MGVTMGNLMAGPIKQVKLGTDSSETDVGLVGGPVRFAKESTLVKWRGPKGGNIKTKEVTRDLKITFTFLELTLENLATALGLPTTAVAANVLTVDEQERDPVSILASVDAADNKTWTYDFPACKLDSAGNVEYDHENPQAVEATFEVLQNVSSGDYYTVTRA